MEFLVKFKNELKQAQIADKKILKQLEREIELARNIFGQITNISPKTFGQKFPVLYKEILISEEYKTFLKNPSEFFQVDLKNLLENILRKNRTFYNLNQQIINAMDNEKIINYIDIQRLLMLLATSNLSLEETFEIFKKAVAFDLKFLETKKGIKVPNAEFVLLLKDFFDNNGNFWTGKDDLVFKLLLEQILFDFKSSYYSLLKDGIIAESLYVKLTSSCDKLVHDYTEFLRKFNEKAEDMKSDITLSSENTISVSVRKPPFGELKKYYRNGIVILIPENLDEFENLLDECGIPAKEKSNIFKQINQKLECLQEEKILGNLSIFDRTIFNEALIFLANCNDVNSHVRMTAIINDIKSYLELLDELYNKNSSEVRERVEEIENFIVPSFKE